MRPGCYDAIVTSGEAARTDLAARAAERRLPFYYLGPDSDASILKGLDVERTGIDEAALALCVGLRNDLVETPADYAGDTVRAETEVLAKRESQSRPGQGIVTVRTRGLNQRDEVVIDFERTIMLPLADRD